jgi:hypothetical protein
MVVTEEEKEEEEEEEEEKKKKKKKKKKKLYDLKGRRVVSEVFELFLYCLCHINRVCFLP